MPGIRKYCEAYLRVAARFVKRKEFMLMLDGWTATSP
jgi:hypothetical protein